MKILGWRVTVDVAPPWRAWRLRAVRAEQDLAVARAELTAARAEIVRLGAELATARAEIVRVTRTLGESCDVIEAERQARARVEGERDGLLANVSGARPLSDAKILN